MRLIGENQIVLLTHVALVPALLRQPCHLQQMVFPLHRLSDVENILNLKLELEPRSLRLSFDEQLAL